MAVQLSFPEPRPTTNPYIVMLRDSLQSTPGVEPRVFSWRAALLGRYDVFHVHWPELLLQGSSRWRTALREVLTLALLVRLCVRRTPVVRTLHNLGRPSGLSRMKRLLLAALDRRTALVIMLNAASVNSGVALTRTIVHGHYREWFSPYDKSVSMPGQLAYFGLLRPYKGVDDLIRAFRALPGPYGLRIAGKADPSHLAETLRALAESDERIELTFGYVRDQELVEVATHGELVVLPYRDMYNSGSVLAALSLDRPVLVPRNAVNEALSAEVGGGWVQMYEGELTSSTLLNALQVLHAAARRAAPDLSRREWTLTGAHHLEAYSAAIRTSSRRG